MPTCSLCSKKATPQHCSRCQLLACPACLHELTPQPIILCNLCTQQEMWLSQQRPDSPPLWATYILENETLSSSLEEDHLHEFSVEMQAQLERLDKEVELAFSSRPAAYSMLDKHLGHTQTHQNHIVRQCVRHLVAQHVIPTKGSMLLLCYLVSYIPKGKTANLCMHLLNGISGMLQSDWERIVQRTVKQIDTKSMSFIQESKLYLRKSLPGLLTGLFIQILPPPNLNQLLQSLFQDLHSFSINLEHKAVEILVDAIKGMEEQELRMGLPLHMRKKMIFHSSLVKRSRSMSFNQTGEEDEMFLEKMGLKMQTLQRMIGSLDPELYEATIEKQKKQLLAQDQQQRSYDFAAQTNRGISPSSNSIDKYESMLADSQLIIQKFKQREQKLVLLLHEKDQLLQSMENQTVEVLANSDTLSEVIRGMARLGTFGLRIARHLRKWEGQKKDSRCDIF